jgi:hypothetical protein
LAIVRKRCRRTIRREAAPTVVAYYLNPEVSIQERMAVVALRLGTATVSHFDVLADCRDMLTLAACEKNDESTMAICELGLVALENIKARYREINRIGASGDEIQALQALEGEGHESQAHCCRNFLCRSAIAGGQERGRHRHHAVEADFRFVWPELGRSAQENRGKFADLRRGYPLRFRLFFTPFRCLHGQIDGAGRTESGANLHPS